MRQSDIRVLLHNIRSAHNVGSIFRTSDAIGVSHIYLSGYSPLPLDKFKRPVKEIAKTALGAEESIPWEYVKNPATLMKRLQSESFSVVAIEQDVRAVDYKQFHPQGKTLILVGNEVLGLSSHMKKHADTIVEIPMLGKKESLNVAVAYGIAMFGLFDKEK
jgi:tRNA G18 (ribose-2'-O)-methylase SpoU